MTSIPELCKISYNATQYTPVDSIATVAMSRLFSQAANRFRSSVNAWNVFTGSSQSSGGTATT